MIDDRNDLEFITDDIDTVSEESVDEVKEVSKMAGRAVTRAADPAPETIVGQINHVRTVGGSEITPDKPTSAIKLTPQGTAEVTFTLSGDVLSLIPKYAFSSTQSVPGNFTNNTDSLGTIIQKAYQETIEDANVGFKFTGTALNARDNLHFALRNILGTDKGSDGKINLIFRPSNGGTKVVSFKGEVFFPDREVSEEYIRHIVDLDAMNGKLSKSTGAAKTTVASDIPIKMMVRTDKPDSGTKLETNTEYQFIGIQDDKPFQLNTTPSEITGIDSSNKKINLTGFTMGNFKTDKSPAEIKVKANIFDSTNKPNSSVDIIFNGIDKTIASNVIPTEFYVSNIGSSVYIDMKDLIDKSSINSAGDYVVPSTQSSLFENKIEPTGTSIKFKPLVFSDPDKSINKIEFENDRGELFKAELKPEDSSKTDSPGYLEVVGLQRATPYIFKKLHITSRTGNTDFSKTIYFTNHTLSGTTEIEKMELNKLSIRTTHFYGPKLELVNDPTESGSALKLPDGLEVKSVKNDRTALRYIIKPDNSEGTLGDITINGLRDEKYKIEKVLDKNGKISYWILTLYNLIPDYDYGFLILELSYTDPNGNKSITRQALGEINRTTDTKYDNRTEKTALPLNEQFEIVVQDKVEAKDPRNVEVPVFVDDIHGKFVGIEMTPPKEHPDAKAEYEIGKIKFTNLTPDKTGVFRVDFLHNPDADNNSTYAFKNSNIQRIARYITITTPKVSDLDIKSATATVDMTTAEFKFEYYSDPKSPIKTVIVKDSAGKEIKSSFDKTTNVLKLEGLKEETKYSKVKVTFTLENSKTIEYTLEDFTTEKKEEKPTGKVAEFVAKVYTLALGREPEVEGWKFWVQKLESKELTVTQFIYDLMKQDEFVSRLMTKEQFIKMMYEIIVGREPEEEGQKYWEQKYEEYRTQETTLADVRIRIVREMMDTAEFKAYVSSLGLKY